MKTIKIGDDPSVYATGNDNCKTSTTGTSIPKQKPKELDIDQLLDQFRFMIIDEQEESWQKEPEEKRIADCQEIIKKEFIALLTQQRKELLEEITDILDNIDTGMYVDDKWVSNSEELTELRKNINLLNKKDETK